MLSGKTWGSPPPLDNLSETDWGRTVNPWKPGAALVTGGGFIWRDTCYTALIDYPCPPPPPC